MMNYFLLNKKSKYNFFYIKIVKIKQQKITNFKIFIKINIYIYSNTNLNKTFYSYFELMDLRSL